MLNYLNGELTVLLMKNIDLLAVWSVMAICFIGVTIPAWYVFSCALTNWWPWYRDKFFAGRYLADLITDGQCMAAMLIIGIIFIVAPILVVIVYMHLTGMSIPDIWAHPMNANWRW